MWISEIDRIIDHSNNQPHESLNGLTPTEAFKDAHKQQEFEINFNRNKSKDKFNQKRNKKKYNKKKIQKNNLNC